MKKNLILILSIVLILVIFVFVAYMIDTNKIATFADEQSDTTIQDLTEIPSPDQSIISKIYTAIGDFFK